MTFTLAATVRAPGNSVTDLAVGGDTGGGFIAGAEVVCVLATEGLDEVVEAVLLADKVGLAGVGIGHVFENGHYAATSSVISISTSAWRHLRSLQTCSL